MLNIKSLEYPVWLFFIVQDKCSSQTLPCFIIVCAVQGWSWINGLSLMMLIKTAMHLSHDKIPETMHEYSCEVFAVSSVLSRVLVHDCRGISLSADIMTENMFKLHCWIATTLRENINTYYIGLGSSDNLHFSDMPWKLTLLWHDVLAISFSAMAKVMCLSILWGYLVQNSWICGDFDEISTISSVLSLLPDFAIFRNEHADLVWLQLWRSDVHEPCNIVVTQELICSSGRSLEKSLMDTKVSVLVQHIATWFFIFQMRLCWELTSTVDWSFSCCNLVTFLRTKSNHLVILSRFTGYLRIAQVNPNYCELMHLTLNSFFGSSEVVSFCWTYFGAFNLSVSFDKVDLGKDRLSSRVP